MLRKLRRGTLVLGAEQLAVNIAQVRGADDAFILRVVELTSREAAANWTNAVLWVDESVFPAIEEDDTFYYWQLEGLDARTHDGETIGKVRFIQNFGAGDLLVIRTARGDLDIPFMEPWVGEVNLEQGFVIVDPAWLESD